MLTDCISPARTARQAAGLSLAEAAKRLRISARYLGQVERMGAPYSLALRVSRLYHCKVDVFLPRPRATEPRRSALRGPRPMRGGDRPTLCRARELDVERFHDDTAARVRSAPYEARCGHPPVAAIPNHVGRTDPHHEEKATT